MERACPARTFHSFPPDDVKPHVVTGIDCWCIPVLFQPREFGNFEGATPIPDTPVCVTRIHPDDIDMAKPLLVVHNRIPFRWPPSAED